MNKFIKYIVSTVIGLVFALVICLAKKVFSQDTAEEVFHILTDAFFVPGAVLLCVGLLMFSANNGAFTMLGYGVKRFVGIFRRDYSKKLHDTYANYRIAKLENQHPVVYLIIVGAVFIGISMIFLLCYYQAR